MKESDLLFGLLASFDKQEYSFSDITWLTAPFQVTESSLRTNLSRMVERKTLQVRKEGRKAFYRFTEKSLRIRSNVAKSFQKPSWDHWENNWWGVSVSLPKGESSQRYYINKKLANHRFAPLHPGLWIRPYNRSEEIEKWLKILFQKEYVKSFVFTFYMEDELSTIPQLWNMDELNREFRNCIENIKISYDRYNLDNPQESLVGKMVIGNRIVKHLFRDPMLPECFLPDNWQGDVLREAFQEWDLMTTRKSKPYWEKIFREN